MYWWEWSLWIMGCLSMWITIRKMIFSRSRFPLLLRQPKFILLAEKRGIRLHGIPTKKLLGFRRDTFPREKTPPFFLTMACAFPPGFISPQKESASKVPVPSFTTSMVGPRDKNAQTLLGFPCP